MILSRSALPRLACLAFFWAATVHAQSSASISAVIQSQGVREKIVGVVTTEFYEFGYDGRGRATSAGVVQDSSGGLSLAVPSAMIKGLNLHPGILVEVEGEYSKQPTENFTAENVRILGTAPLPQPRRVGAADACGSANGNELVSLRGRLVPGRKAGEMFIQDDSGMIQVIIPPFEFSEDVRDIFAHGGRAQLRGVIFPHLNLPEWNSDCYVTLTEAADLVVFPGPRYGVILTIVFSLAALFLIGYLWGARRAERRRSAGLEAISHDLESARDAAVEASKAKSMFLANMSHEIRTPLNGVLGLGELLLDSELNPEQRDYAETMQVCAQSLLSVLNDVLDFSKIEAGQLQFEDQVFSVRDVLDQVRRITHPGAQQKGLTVRDQTPNELPAAVVGDSNRLRQVLLNLVGNAIKFSERGDITVSVKTISQDCEGIHLRFEVQDQGVGIDPETQRLLFKPFVQGDGSISRRFGGTGLGLAISKWLVENGMKGTIGVKSELGGGSTFYFSAVFGREQEEALPGGNSEYKRAPATALNR